MASGSIGFVRFWSGVLIIMFLASCLVGVSVVLVRRLVLGVVVALLTAIIGVVRQMGILLRFMVNVRLLWVLLGIS
jgi:hypothetical protein